MKRLKKLRDVKNNQITKLTLENKFVSKFNPLTIESFHKEKKENNNI